MPNSIDCKTHLDHEGYELLTPAMRVELNQILASIKVPTGPSQQELDELIEEEDGFTSPGSTAEIALGWLMHMYHHKLCSICCYFTNPMHQEHADRDSKYWQNFYVGCVNIPGFKTPEMSWARNKSSFD